MAEVWPQPHTVTGARGHDVDASTITTVPGRVLSDLSVNGTTGTMTTRGQLLQFELVYPLLTLAQYNQFKPFETTHLEQDITFEHPPGTSYTCVLVEEPFFDWYKGSVYRGRALLRQKDTS